MIEKKHQGTVIAVCKNGQPGIPKYEMKSIHLIKGSGVEGDYHAGKNVRHRYLAKKDPSRLNNRQVLIIDTTILDDLESQGIKIKPGEMGENLVLDGIDVMALELGTVIQVGETVLELNEIRVPCSQLNSSHPDLHQAVVKKVGDKEEYNAGVFAHITTGGEVKPGNQISIMSENGT